MNYFFHLVTFYCIYTLAGLSLNLVMGWLGMVSLAHAGYVALGAYSYAILSTYFNLPFIIVFPLVILVGATFGLLLSLPSWRFKGDLFIVISLAVQALIYGAIKNWYNPDAEPGSILNLTNGTFGISGIRPAHLFGIEISSDALSAMLSIIVLVGSILFFRRLVHSPWGRTVRGLRDDELALRSLGKSIRTIKIEVFAFSGALAALAGMLYASYIRFINPDIASLDESIAWISIAVIGGLGTIRGTMVGAAVVLFFPEAFRLLELPAAVAANGPYLAYGLLLVFCMHWRPQRIFGECEVD